MGSDTSQSDRMCARDAHWDVIQGGVTESWRDPFFMEFRMRRILLAAALVTVTPALASAQGGSWVTSVGGGVTLPIGDAGDAYDTGFHGLAGIAYRPAASKLSYGVDASFHRFNQKAFTDGNANVFIAMARMNYDISPSAYLIGGLGLVRNENKATVNNVEFTNTNSDAAFTAGAGFNFGKSLFVEGRLINVFSDPSMRLIPITLGVRF
jgi:hypothetical protein